MQREQRGPSGGGGAPASTGTAVVALQGVAMSGASRTGFWEHRLKGGRDARGGM